MKSHNQPDECIGCKVMCYRYSTLEGKMCPCCEDELRWEEEEEEETWNFTN